MRAANFLEGRKCWLCDHADTIEPQPALPHVRYGCHLGSVPPSHRIGDFVHCTARVASTILKRLQEGAQGVSGECLRELHAFGRTLALDAQEVAQDDRLPPRLTKPGELDLTVARFFVQDTRYHRQLQGIIEKHVQATFEWVPGRRLRAHFVVGLLLQAFHTLHRLWRMKTPLGDADIALYATQVDNFRRAWALLQWKVTPWVHWILAHSLNIVKTFRTIYAFSSIPTEMRHKHFKRDLKHCFLGGKRKTPARSARGIVHLLHQDALDKGLYMLSLDRESHSAPVPKRRRH